MDMILKTTDLCKNFKGQMAVNNVSLNIRRNSVYGLLGPNGAGKSASASDQANRPMVYFHPNCLSTETRVPR